MCKKAAFLICMVFAVLLLLFPQISTSAVSDALALWGLTVVPALLPFFILSGFCLRMGLDAEISKISGGFMQRIFNTSGNCVFPFVVSIISGYPSGVKIIADMRIRNMLTKNQAKRAVSFCSTSGPLFMIGAVGSSMLGSAAAGWVIAISHYLGALVNGIIFGRICGNKAKTGKNEKSGRNEQVGRRAKSGRDAENVRRAKAGKRAETGWSACRVSERENFGVTGSESRSAGSGSFCRTVKTRMPEAANEKSCRGNAFTGGWGDEDSKSVHRILASAITDSVNTLLLIFGYMAVFMTVLYYLKASYPALPEWISGIVELSAGCRDTAQNAYMTMIQKCIICTVMISFGGFCVIFQSIGFLSRTDIGAGYFVIVKLFHAFFSGIAAALIGKVVFKIKPELVYTFSTGPGKISGSMGISGFIYRILFSQGCICFIAFLYFAVLLAGFAARVVKKD